MHARPSGGIRAAACQNAPMQGSAACCASSGVLGGLASALFAVLYYPDNAHLMAHGAAQPRYQLLGLGITLAVAVGGGALSGLLVSKVDLSGAGQALAVGQLYEDAVYWKHVPAEDADAEGEEEEGKH